METVLFDNSVHLAFFGSCEVKTQVLVGRYGLQDDMEHRIGLEDTDHFSLSFWKATTSASQFNHSSLDHVKHGCFEHLVELK